MSTVSTYAGTSGRVQLVAISPTLTTDVITYTGTPTTVTEAFGWSANVQKTETSFVGFENDANAQGVVFKQQLRGGVGSWTATIETGATAAQAFAVGQGLVVDLLYQKGADTGWEGLNCVVTGFNPQTGMQQQYARMSINVEGDGAWPAGPT